MDTSARFRFGRNWLNFSRSIDESRIQSAEQSLKAMLGLKSLSGTRFLDIGSGSGLSSLAAHRLGAKVHSFDFDLDSVACTAKVKQEYAADSPAWEVRQGSVLDQQFLDSCGQFDIVYSWGVLHHTGDMWGAMNRVSCNVAPEGLLFLSIYNDQGWKSLAWAVIKRTYSQFAIARPLLILAYLVFPAAPSLLYGAIRRRRRPRGMNFWHDLIDWLGGYPFEVASPQQVVDFYEAQGFALVKIKTVGENLGCNEYVFKRGGQT